MIHDEMQRLVRARAVTDDAHALHSNCVEHGQRILGTRAGITEARFFDRVRHAEPAVIEHDAAKLLARRLPGLGGE